MCGINGVLFNNASSDIERKINEMNDAIIHRGPDEEGIYIYQDRLAMGMRRLSIIDLSTGNQPIYNDDRSLVIVFNGEIYNFLILKEELKAKGVVFRTNSDTEVLLKMYETYGVEAFKQLNGMFAFSIHDIKLNKLLIVRDRFGEKPLYYYKNDECIYWASELKSIKIVAPNIKKAISPKALSLYFSLSYIPAPYSIYQSVYKLRAGHFLSINTNDCCPAHARRRGARRRRQPGDRGPRAQPPPGGARADQAADRGRRAAPWLSAGPGGGGARARVALAFVLCASDRRQHVHAPARRRRARHRPVAGGGARRC